MNNLNYKYQRLVHFLMVASVLLMLLLSFTNNVLAGPEGRTRNFCHNIFNGGEDRPCGGHLEPACTSGAACDTGFNSYSGSPFPININCPSPIADETVSVGCYDTVPSCADCSGAGQVPCPKEASAYCKVGCDDGLVQNPTTTICERPQTPGTACGPGFPCGTGLTCDLTSLKCVAPAKAGESCANPFVSCADGLSCTASLECSHSPAQRGETCDIANHCGDGLYCKPGIPQRCQPYRKHGESCGPAYPCGEGTQCELCLSGNCKSTFQCVYNANNGAITEQGCRNMYAQPLHNGAKNSGLTMTYGGGNGASLLVPGESQEFGIAYGADGQWGCYTTFCYGLNSDISIEQFGALGFYQTFAAVGGTSFANVQEVQIPGDLVNFATSQIYSRDPGEVIPASPELIGTADAFAIGVGADILPFSAASMLCETTLDAIVELPDEQKDIVIPSPQPIPTTSTGYGALAFDGTNDKLVLSDSVALAALTMTDAFTLEAWINPGKELQDLSILSKEGEYQIGLLDGELAFSIANTQPGWVWTHTGYYPPVNRWTHVALVYGDFGAQTEQRMYVNGELLHTSQALGAIGDRHPESPEFHIGGRQRYTPTFSGSIDEVRLWSRVLTQDEIRRELIQAPNVADANFVAGWDFAERDGDIINDVGTGGFELSLIGQGTDAAPTREWEMRLQNGIALYFDGIDDHVVVAADDSLAALKVNNTLTLEAWVHAVGPGSGPAGGTIINKEGEYYLGRSADGFLNFALANSVPGWTTVKSNVSVPLHRWSHVALVYDSAAAQVVLYLNGVPAETIAANGTIGDNHTDKNELRIGGRQNDDAGGTGQRFHGDIDEVRVWNVARSAGEINSAYSAELSAATPGLVGYWGFDELELDVTFDKTNAHRNALLGSRREWAKPKRVEANALRDYPATLIDYCSGTPFPDDDGDGVCNAIDNCPTVANADQADSNGDGEGNACTPVTITGGGNGNSGGGGGGGCAYNPAAKFDPMLPLFILLSAIYLSRRRYCSHV